MANVNILSERSFKDLDLNFTIHPVKKDINTHKNEYAIINSVKNLILTNHYERPFRPDLGSNIRRMLFEQIDSVTAAQIEREISEVIGNCEHRAKVSRVVASPSTEENGYSIYLEFFIVNSPVPITINFFLERIIS